MNPENTLNKFRLLRAIALLFVVAGAAGSMDLMLSTAHPPFLLLVLFTGWVLSPFVGLLIASRIARHWSESNRMTLYILMLVIPSASLIGYSGVWSPPGARPAFAFLMVPLISWVLMAIVLLIAWSRARRRNDKGKANVRI